MDNIDIHLYSDGSGTVSDKESSWYGIVKIGDIEKKVFGGSNIGTNNHAELSAIFNAIWFIRASLPKQNNLKIKIITDSEWVVKTAKKEYAYPVNHNAMFFEGIEYAINNWGYQITWTHIPRNTTKENAECDESAGKLRKIIKELNTK